MNIFDDPILCGKNGKNCGFITNGVANYPYCKKYKFHVNPASFDKCDECKKLYKEQSK